jgi:hypothetical protein
MAQVIATLGAGRPDASLACTNRGLLERDWVATICPLPEIIVKVCDWTTPAQNAQINKARMELQARDEIIGTPRNLRTTFRKYIGRTRDFLQLTTVVKLNCTNFHITLAGADGDRM